MECLVACQTFVDESLRDLHEEVEYNGKFLGLYLILSELNQLEQIIFSKRRTLVADITESVRHLASDLV